MDRPTRELEVSTYTTAELSNPANAMSAASAAWAARCQQPLGLVFTQVSERLGRWELIRHKEEQDSIFLSVKINGDPIPTIEMERTVDFVRLEVSHDALLITPEGKGYGKRLLGNCFGIYRRCGIRRVTVRAGLDLGPYVWGRVGFVPTEESWEGLRQLMRSNLATFHTLIPHSRLMEIREDLGERDPHALWIIVDDPYQLDTGEKLARRLLSGAKWEGYFDLTDKAALNRFYHYIGEPQ